MHRRLVMNGGIPIERIPPSFLLVLLSLINWVFTLISSLVLLSGYLVTCREIQYETRRKIHASVVLGIPFKNLFLSCFSLMRNTDLTTRFNFNHYELAGQWYGKITSKKTY